MIRGYPNYISYGLMKSSAYVYPGWLSENFLGNFYLLNIIGNGTLPELAELISLISIVSSAK